MDDVVGMTRCDGVAQICLNRPRLSNALDPAHFRQLALLLSTLDEDPDVRAIVLTGAGERAFCSGLNLKAGEALDAEFEGDAGTGLGMVLRRAIRLRKPLIGRINGACVAGGIGLLAACDMAVAAGDAVFALPEINVGLYPFVVLAGLADRVPAADLESLATGGHRINAAEALRMRLVDEVVDRAELDATVSRMVAVACQRNADRKGASTASATGQDHDGYDARIAEAERQSRLFRKSPQPKTPTAD